MSRVFAYRLASVASPDSGPLRRGATAGLWSSALAGHQAAVSAAASDHSDTSLLIGSSKMNETLVPSRTLPYLSRGAKFFDNFFR